MKYCEILPFLSLAIKITLILWALLTDFESYTQFLGYANKNIIHSHNDLSVKLNITI